MKAQVSVHWLAQCHTKWLRSCREFKHSAIIKLMESNYLLIALSTEPVSHEFVSIYWKKLCITCHILQAWTELLSAGLSFSDRSRWISRPETIHQNSWLQTFINTSHGIGHRLDSLKLRYIHFAQFLLNAHLAAQNFRKVRTKNLKFRTDLQEHIMDGWSVTQ